MTRSEFVERYGGIYEHSPWIAEQAYDMGAVDGNIALATVFGRCVDGADRETKLALIRAHPDLAGKAAVAGELTQDSSVEQRSAGIDQCTFDEYLQARGMHFFIRCYHCDNNMLELCEFLGTYGISIFDWLVRLNEGIEDAPDGVRQVYRDFIQGTRDELWDSPQELLDFWNKPENQNGFIDGEWGDNQFFKFRAIGITTAYHDMARYGGDMAGQMILERNPGISHEAVQQEIDDIVRYMCLKRRLPIDIEHIIGVTEDDFAFDIAAWQEGRYNGQLCDFRPKEDVRLRFYYTDSQVKKLVHAYELHGKSRQGISMILRKNNPLFFVRETMRID